MFALVDNTELPLSYLLTELEMSHRKGLWLFWNFLFLLLNLFGLDRLELILLVLEGWSDGKLNRRESGRLCRQVTLYFAGEFHDPGEEVVDVGVEVIDFLQVLRGKPFNCVVAGLIDSLGDFWIPSLCCIHANDN